jgi:Ca2+-binding EF-hand superfamily protein
LPCKVARVANMATHLPLPQGGNHALGFCVLWRLSDGLVLVDTGDALREGGPAGEREGLGSIGGLQADATRVAPTDRGEKTDIVADAQRVMKRIRKHLSGETVAHRYDRLDPLRILFTSAEPDAPNVLALLSGRIGCAVVFEDSLPLEFPMRFLLEANLLFSHQHPHACDQALRPMAFLGFSSLLMQLRLRFVDEETRSRMELDPVPAELVHHRTMSEAVNLHTNLKLPRERDLESRESAVSRQSEGQQQHVLAPAEGEALELETVKSKASAVSDVSPRPRPTDKQAAVQKTRLKRLVKRRFDMHLVMSLKTYFQEMDNDGDGHVSRPEFVQAMERHQAEAEEVGNHHAMSFTASFFDLIDRDASDDITFGELVRLIFPQATLQERECIVEIAFPPARPVTPPPRLTREQEEELTAIFNMYDADGGGTIDVLELRGSAEQMGMSPLEMKRLFATLDADGDGQVTLEEFLSGFEFMFAS